jgi:hypothetical protein
MRRLRQATAAAPRSPGPGYRTGATRARAQAVRRCAELTSLQLDVADGSAMTVNLNRLLGASKARAAPRSLRQRARRLTNKLAV